MRKALYSFSRAGLARAFADTRSWAAGICWGPLLIGSSAANKVYSTCVSPLGDDLLQVEVLAHGADPYAPPGAIWIGSFQRTAEGLALAERAIRHFFEGQGMILRGAQ